MVSKSDSGIPFLAAGGGSGRGLGSWGDSQGVVGTEVHRAGRAVWAVDVPHSVLAEEVPRVAISVV